jgi:hypothetical protein
MEVVCRCGYHGNQMVEFESETPSKKLVTWNYSNYVDFVEWKVQGTKTLIWACPQCSKVLVRQLGGAIYNGSEQKEMRKRLWNNSQKNKQYLNAVKLPPGKYVAKIVGIRKTRNKPQLHVTLLLDNEVVVKEAH